MKAHSAAVVEARTASAGRRECCAQRCCLRKAARELTSTFSLWTTAWTCPLPRAAIATLLLPAHYRLGEQWILDSVLRAGMRADLRLAAVQSAELLFSQLTKRRRLLPARYGETEPVIAKPAANERPGLRGCLTQGGALLHCSMSLRAAGCGRGA